MKVISASNSNSDDNISINSKNKNNGLMFFIISYKTPNEFEKIIVKNELRALIAVGRSGVAQVA